MTEDSARREGEEVIPEFDRGADAGPNPTSRVAVVRTHRQSVDVCHGGRESCPPSTTPVPEQLALAIVEDDLTFGEWLAQVSVVPLPDQDEEREAA